MRVKLGVISAAVVLAGCEQSTTGPEMRPVERAPAAIVVSPGLSVYTDRTSWEAAVATAGGTVTNMDFTGLTLGRVSQLETDYGAFKIKVDDVGANQFSNPGIDVFPDAGCSLGTGDCDVFNFIMHDPTSALDGPKLNQLIFPQNIIAFGGDFIQVGITVPPPGSATGTVTLRIGSESVAINSYLDAGGNGFFGFVATAADTISYTFVKSGSIQNDIFQIYNPAYANAPAGPDPEPDEMIGDLLDDIAGLGLPAGIASSLNSKLNAALAALGANNTAAACTALQDLINHTQAQSGKKISTSAANAIIAAATAIRSELGCS